MSVSPITDCNIWHFCGWIKVEILRLMFPYQFFWYAGQIAQGNQPLKLGISVRYLKASYISIFIISCCNKKTKTGLQNWGVSYMWMSIHKVYFTYIWFKLCWWVSRYNDCRVKSTGSCLSKEFVRCKALAYALKLNPAQIWYKTEPSK